MTNGQYSNSAILRRRCSLKCRVAAGLFAAGVIGGGAVVWLSAHGHLDLTAWLGVCGFKQRYALPCPGCGWTHSLQLCVTGHPVEGFVHQPAAAFFCVVGAAAGIYALLIAVFGIDFGFPRRLLAAVGVKTLVISAVVVFLAGWLVRLLRVLLQGDGI